MAVVPCAIDPVDVEHFDTVVFERMDLEAEDRVGHRNLRVEDGAFEEEEDRRVDSLEKKDEGDIDFEEVVEVCHRRLHRHIHHHIVDRADTLPLVYFARLLGRHTGPVEEALHLVVRQDTS